MKKKTDMEEKAKRHRSRSKKVEIKISHEEVDRINEMLLDGVSKAMRAFERKVKILRMLNEKGR